MLDKSQEAGKIGNQPTQFVSNNSELTYLLHFRQLSGLSGSSLLRVSLPSSSISFKRKIAFAWLWTDDGFPT